MKKSIIIQVVFIVAAMFTCSAIAADATKIGVVDFNRIFIESSAGKVMQKDLEAKRGELQAKISAGEKKYKEMREALERESLVLSAEKKFERVRELENKEADLKQMKSDYSKELQFLKQTRMQQIQKDVLEIINKKGKEQGYLLIIERNSAGAIYITDKVDITDEVIKEYNSIYAKKK